MLKKEHWGKGHTTRGKAEEGFSLFSTFILPKLTGFVQWTLQERLKKEHEDRN
jgi:hypothetical protein